MLCCGGGVGKAKMVYGRGSGKGRKKNQFVPASEASDVQVHSYLLIINHLIETKCCAHGY